MKRLPKPVQILIKIAVPVAVLAVGYAFSTPRVGYEPHQPILFQHSKMAAQPNWVVGEDGQETNLGGYGIECIYCHTMAYKGRHSTLPSTDICMNCHSFVGQDKEWVLVLKEYHERRQPIPWVKVHDLPDFAYYDHSAHLNARDEKGQPLLDCVTCHGDVENHDVVKVRTRFNMGWCLDCHRKPEMGASTDCIICHR